MTSAAVPLSHSSAFDVFKNHNLQVNQLLMNELSIAISTNNPLVKAIAKGGPLATAFKCKQNYKDHFNILEPVKYVLEPRSKKTFQYVPLLKSLQQLLGCTDIVEKLGVNQTACSVNRHQYANITETILFFR